MCLKGGIPTRDLHGDWNRTIYAGELEISGEIDLQFFGENWSCSMGFQPTGSKHIMRSPISYANLSTGQRMGCGQFETKLEPVLYVSHNN